MLGRPTVPQGLGGSDKAILPLGSTARAEESHLRGCWQGGGWILQPEKSVHAESDQVAVESLMTAVIPSWARSASLMHIQLLVLGGGVVVRRQPKALFNSVMYGDQTPPPGFSVYS